jgi:hypothetical protein
MQQERADICLALERIYDHPAVRALLLLRARVGRDGRR